MSTAAWPLQFPFTQRSPELPPFVASLVALTGVIGLILLTRDRQHPSSMALWLPVVWVSIGASRMVSQWFQSGEFLDSPDQYLDGSPFDRLILTAILLAGLGVLLRRRDRTFAILKQNAPLVLFFMYCAASAIWSDFPVVALKRWTKALGNLAMVIVVLTELNPMSAIRQFLGRVALLLIPASVLVIKYYPDIGRSYDRWTGTAYYNGVAVGKNSLGSVCLVFGLASLWLLAVSLAARPRRYSTIAAHAAVFGMALWLLHLAQSATSIVCFLIGGVLMLALSVLKKPAIVHVAIAAAVVAGIVGFAFLQADAMVIGALGRDATLTGRTELWHDVLAMNSAPLIGTGFESFWLGDRAEALWAKYWWHPNQAHNGYIEVYLNLGIVGLCLVSLLVASGYRNIFRTFRQVPSVGALKLALLAAALFYNFTEAAFKVMHPVWIVFILAVIADPSFTEVMCTTEEPLALVNPNPNHGRRPGRVRSSWRNPGQSVPTALPPAAATRLRRWR